MEKEFENFINIDKKTAWPEMKFFIDNVPNKIWGGVGGNSYTGWVYQQGFFAALVKSYKNQDSLKILDFGCGYGKLAPASSFLTYPEGYYVGIDVMQHCIDLCKSKYSSLPRTSFVLSDDLNERYTVKEFDADSIKKPCGNDWSINSRTLDVVMSISVFTHLQETDALAYINKIYEVLKSNGIAILTFHILQEPRKNPLFISEKGNNSLDRIFKFQTQISPNWFTSSPELPERAIAISKEGLTNLIGDKFKIENHIKGTTTGSHSPFCQDVVVLRKIGAPKEIIESAKNHPKLNKSRSS